MGTRPPNQRLLWFMDDNSSTTTGNPQKWLILKESNILNSGYGVLLLDHFNWDIITKYIGIVAILNTKSGKRKQAAWGREGSAEFDYRLALEQKGKNILLQRILVRSTSLDIFIQSLFSCSGSGFSVNYYGHSINNIIKAYTMWIKYYSI